MQEEGEPEPEGIIFCCRYLSLCKQCFVFFCVFVFLVHMFCLFNNICLSGGPGVEQEQTNAFKTGSNAIVLKKGDGIGLVVAVVVVATIIVFIFGFYLNVYWIGLHHYSGLYYKQ